MDFMKEMPYSKQEEEISYWTNYFAGMHSNTLKTFNYELPIDSKNFKDIDNPKINMLNEIVKEYVDYYKSTPLDKGGAAVGFRKDCKLISESFNTHGNKKIISQFINGELSMPEAALAAQEGGVGNAEYEKIKEFRDWIIKPDTIRRLKKSTKKYTDLERFVDGIVLGLQQASKDLKELREKKK